MKLWNYIVIITGLALFLEFAGIKVAGFTDIFNQIGVTLASTGFSSVEGVSNFWLAVFGSAGILATIALTGITIGTLTRTPIENFIVLPIITGTFFIYGATIFSLVKYAIGGGYESWIGVIIGLILIPLGIGFTISSIDYFRGNG